MFTPDQYQLLDFGRGRKLERFGSQVLDRPSTAADASQPARPELWSEATARYERISADRGRWQPDGKLTERWTVTHGSFSLEFKRTEFGHVGMFPEQVENWRWLAERVAAASTPPRVLNLFAYTGGSTLAAAAAGAQVTHVDAAGNIVAWARRNAELSGLASAPIRWIEEDAATFVRRELKRGRQYDVVVLDPPSYGHGPKGQVWKLTDHLEGLLRDCIALTGGQPQFMLLTCHTRGLGSSQLVAMLGDALDRPADGCELELVSATGRKLPCGAVARWP